MGCRDPGRAARAQTATHVQLPQQQLDLVPVLEVRAVLLVQVRVHLAQQLLRVLHVSAELGDGPIRQEAPMTSRCGFELTPGGAGAPTHPESRSDLLGLRARPPEHSTGAAGKEAGSLPATPRASVTVSSLRLLWPGFSPHSPLCAEHLT